MENRTMEPRQLAPGKWEVMENSIFLNELCETLQGDENSVANRENVAVDKNEGVEPAEDKLKLHQHVFVPMMKRFMIAQIKKDQKIQEAVAQGIPRPKYKDPAAEDYKKFLQLKEMELKKEKELDMCHSEKVHEQLQRNSELRMSDAMLGAHEKNKAAANALLGLLPHIKATDTFWQHVRTEYNDIMTGSYDQPAAVIDLMEQEPAE